MALGAADLAGRRLAESRFSVREAGDAQDVLARTVAAASGLADRLAGQHGPLRGVGAVSPGIVQEDRIRLAPNIPGWESIQLRRTLCRALPTDTVSVATDAKAAALAEATQGTLAGLGCGVFLNLGTGTSAASRSGCCAISAAITAPGMLRYSPALPLPHQGSGRERPGSAGQSSGKTCNQARIDAEGTGENR